MVNMLPYIGAFALGVSGHAYYWLLLMAIISVIIYALTSGEKGIVRNYSHRGNRFIFNLYLIHMLLLSMVFVGGLAFDWVF